MTKIKRLAALLCAPLFFAAASCQYPDAYVFTPREFDRTSPNFRKTPLDLTSITVCARPFHAADERAVSLANEECQRYGKSAAAPQPGFGACPLLLASVLTFKCVAPTPS